MCVGPCHQPSPHRVVSSQRDCTHNVHAHHTLPHSVTQPQAAMQEDHGGYLHTSLGGYLPQALGSVGVTSSGNVYSETPPESTADMDRDAKLQARRERNKLAARKCRMNKSLQVAELETQLHTAHADNSALAGHIAKVVALYQRERTTKDQFRGLMLALSAQLPPVVGSSSSGGGSSSLSIARVVNALESDPPTMSYDEALHGIAVQAGALHAALERAGRMQEALGAALTQQQALQAQLQATLQAQQAEQQGQGQGQAAEQTVLRPSVKDPCQQPAGSAPAPQAHAQAQPRGAQASLSRQPAMPYVGPTSFTATVTRAAEQVPPGSRPGGPSLAAQAAAHRGATTECITEDTFHTTAQIQPRLHTDDAAQEGSLRIEHVVSSAHEPSTALGQQQPGSTQSSRSKRKRSLDSAPMPPVESSMQYSQRPIREHGDLKASAGMLHGRDPQACVHEPANGLHLLLAAVAAPEMQAPVAEAAHEWYAE